MNGFTRATIAFLAALGLIGCGGQPPAKTDSKSVGSTTDAAKATSKSKPTESGQRKGYRDKEESIIPDRPTQAQKEKASRTTAATNPDGPKSQGTSEKQHDGKAATPGAEIEFAPVDLAGFEKRIADLKGKTVVVDCWAMWCIPCIQKFPNFVALAGKHASGKLVFVALNFDDEDEGIKSAGEFLREHQASVTNLRMTTKAQVVFKKFGFETLPAYLVFSPDGAVSFKAIGAKAMDELESKLASLK